MCRVLYLDDEPDEVEALTLLLRARRFEVTGVESAAEALRLVETEPFDVVLLDTMMPPTEDMNPIELDYGRETGVEVARRIKACKPAMPIVALTVVIDPDILQRMRQVGIGQVLIKPSDPDPIADALRAAAKVPVPR